MTAAPETGHTRLLTLPEVAEILRVSRRQVQRMLARGDLPSINLGNGFRRIDPDDLAEFIAVRKQPAA